MITTAIRKLIPSQWRPVQYLMDQAHRGARGQIQAGPFKGMKYGRESSGSAYIPKILGIYEREINPAVEKAISQKPDLIVDIGAAEGYYAVGLAMRLPGIRVVAFEMMPSARKSLEQLARMNNVQSQIDIRERCDLISLNKAAADAARPFIVCDCEGFEAILLDPLRVASLARASVLMESHDFVLPGIAEEITARFTSTHKVERIWAEERSPTEYPYASPYSRLLPAHYRRWAVSEWRPERMSWLWMEPFSDSRG